MKQVIYLIFGWIMIAIPGCDQGNIDLDNSGDVPLFVTIDELEYKLAPGQYQQIKLEKGRHVIIIKDKEGKTLDEETFRVVTGGIINVAKANYLIWTDLYGDPKLRKQKLKEDWLDIGDQSFFGEFEQLPTDVFYIEKEWDYGLGEDFPDDLLGWEMGKEKYIIKRKLFRESELIKAYNSLVQGK